MARLHLWLLGAWDVQRDGTPLPPLPTRHARALLARLAMAHPRPVTRTAIICDLFPETTPSRAARHLSTTLYYVRRALGDMLCAGEDEIALDPSLDLWLDTTEFTQAISAGANVERLRHAIDLYRGPFLENPLEGWAATVAGQMEELYVQALRRVIAFAQASGTMQDALDVAERWAAREPWDASAHAALIAAWVALGDRAAADGQLAQARAILRVEGSEPSAPLDALARAIERLPSRPSSRAQTSTPRPRTAPSALVDPSFFRTSFERLPLIGRECELERLHVQWARARQGEAQTIIVEGVAGVGKTRLVSELATQVRLRTDNLVLWGIADETTRDNSLGLLRNACTHWPSSAVERVQNIIRLLDDAQWGLLALYLPELTHWLPDRPPLTLARLAGSDEVQRRHATLAAFFNALAADTTLLLILENAHHSDAETLAFTHVFAQQCTRALLVLTQRPRQSEPPGEKIVLAPLDAQGMERLLRSAGDGALSESLLTALVARSGGNPLFAREILRALVAQHTLE